MGGSGRSGRVGEDVGGLGRGVAGVSERCGERVKGWRGGRVKE